MTTQYEVKVRNRAGALQYSVNDFLGLDYAKYLNGFGRLTVQLSGRHPAIDALEKDGQIEVWRYDDSNNIAPYCDFFGLYRDRDRNTPEESKRGIFKMKCVSQNHYLYRAVTGHAAGTNLRNSFTAVPAETVMKNLVRFNATAEASLTDPSPSNGRKRLPTWRSLITVEADAGGGDNFTKDMAHTEVLTALQEVATVTGLDFDLVKVGARAWEFRTYNPLGSDLTADVKFSLEWDNMGNPVLTGNAIDEKTVAMTWGEGEGAAREFLEVHGPNYADDWNDIEFYVDAKNQGATSLEAAALVRLNEARARDDLGFEAKQSVFRYGRDYCVNGVMGDKVAVTYYEATETKRIRGVYVVVATSSGSTQAEQIRLDMVTVT